MVGSQAADALPEVRDMFKRDPPPAMRPPEEETWWRVTMVRMGLPIAELSYPSDWPTVSKNNEQRQVIAAVARFKPGQ